MKPTSLELEILKDKRQENSKKINILLKQNKQLNERIKLLLNEMSKHIDNLNKIGCTNADSF